MTGPSGSCVRWLHSLLLVILLGAALTAAAGCSADVTIGDETATATLAPSPTASARPAASEPSPRAPLQVTARAARAFEHLRMLTVEIGVRSAGTDGEREAADYIARQFEVAGYQVSLEEFEIDLTFSDVVAADGAGDPMAALQFGGSSSGETSGPLVYAGLGEAPAIAAADVAGAIVLLDRGQLTFALKARNAQDAGARAVVIINSDGGMVRGTLGPGSQVSIPVVGVAGRSGPALRALAERRAQVAIRSGIIEDRSSQNVVARPQGGMCRAYLGAHYDSVPESPGANDNASGTALLIELADASRAAALDEGLCFIAFGAEEIGLVGSAAYVEGHDVSDAAFMINFDMVGRLGQRPGDGPRFVVTGAATATALAEQASAVAAGLGYDIRPARFPRGAASDHVSFDAVGVPAITVHSGGSEFLHTPDDTIETVALEDLEVLLAVSIGLLDELSRVTLQPN